MRVFPLALLAIVIGRVAPVKSSEAIFGVERSPRLAEEGKARRALLCLGMLVRDEEALLRAHLPRWLPMVDYFVVGVDEATTDASRNAVCWPAISNARNWTLAKEISKSRFPNFPGLVLFCIDTSDSESRRIFQHFSRSTRLLHLCTAPVQIFA